MRRYALCRSRILASWRLPPVARALEIAQAEGLDGQPLAKYKRLVQDCKNSMRAVLQRIDAGEMLTQ